MLRWLVISSYGKRETNLLLSLVQFCLLKKLMTSNTTVALHHILLKSPLLAGDIIKELELGADFADLAREYSACPSANNEGFAGYNNLDTLPTGIVTALSAC